MTWHPVDLAILRAATMWPGTVGKHEIAARFGLSPRTVKNRATVLGRLGHVEPGRWRYVATPQGVEQWQRLNP